MPIRRMRKTIWRIVASLINFVAFLLTIVWIQLTWTGFLVAGALLRYEYHVYYSQATEPFVLVSSHLSDLAKAVALVVLLGPLLCFVYYMRKNQDRRWFRVLKGLLVMQPTLLLVIGVVMMIEYRYNPWLDKATKIWAAANA